MGLFRQDCYADKIECFYADLCFVSAHEGTGEEGGCAEADAEGAHGGEKGEAEAEGGGGEGEAASEEAETASEGTREEGGTDRERRGGKGKGGQHLGCAEQHHHD